MKEGGECQKNSGGAKKFLYTRARETAVEEQWPFASKGQDKKPANIPVNLNDVWSIQRNVSLGGVAPRAADHLTYNATRGFYSRHGGIKDVGLALVPRHAQRGNATYSYTSQNVSNSSDYLASSPSRGPRSSAPNNCENHGRSIDEHDF